MLIFLGLAGLHTGRTVRCKETAEIIHNLCTFAVADERSTQ